MFNLRRPLKEPHPTPHGGTAAVTSVGVTEENDKGISTKSISDSRSSKGTLSLDKNGCSDKGVFMERNRAEDEGKDSGRFCSDVKVVLGDGQRERCSSNVCFDEKNCGNKNQPNQGSLNTSAAVAAACDRKRKERHESCSQGQEKKVIRSLSHDEPKSEGGDEKQAEVRRTRSNGNFAAEGEEQDGNDRENDVEHQTNYSSVPGNCDENHFKNCLTSDQKYVGAKMTSHNDVDVALYGGGPSTNPQYGIVRNMPIHFEAEIQRQWERSAQWSSNSNRKVHGFRKHRNQRSSRLNLTTTYRNDYSDGEAEDCLDTVEIIGESSPVLIDDDLHSPSSEESSSSSIISLEDGEVEDPRKGSPYLIGEEDIEADLEEFRIEEKDVPVRVPSNSTSMEPEPSLDFSTLHHQMETNEPISFLAALQGGNMEDQVMLSPRNSMLIKDNSDFPPSPPLYQAPLDPPLSRQIGGNGSLKLNQLSKQVGHLKKQLKFLEDEHEKLMGYKPSHADKLNHKEMRKCLLQLTKAKKELKQIREDPANLRNNETQGNRFENEMMATKTSAEALKNLDVTVKEISALMIEKRRMSCRPEDPALMTPTELAEEKSSMQKQLLMLEKRHGRPCSREEKEVVRCLYDRYRALKKNGARFGNVKENSIDLAPIMEHEPLDFSSNIGKSRDPIIQLKKESQIMVPSSNSPKGRRRRLIINDDDDGDEGSFMNFKNEGFTEMTLMDLEASQRIAKDEKRKLRSILRKFEAEFQAATGRPPQKDEKYSSAEMEATYQNYKRCRATVRLLDVLIAKQKCPQLLTEIHKIED